MSKAGRISLLAGEKYSAGNRNPGHAAIPFSNLFYDSFGFQE